jgi:hypothetical protein
VQGRASVEAAECDAGQGVGWRGRHGLQGSCSSAADHIHSWQCGACGMCRHRSACRSMLAMWHSYARHLFHCLLHCIAASHPQILTAVPFLRGVNPRVVQWIRSRSQMKIYGMVSPGSSRRLVTSLCLCLPEIFKCLCRSSLVS